MNEISLYTDKTADVKLIATELRKLKAVFPALENDFISVLSERISVNGFTEQRLKDAVANVIDNFKYQRPSIADIIGFDTRIRLYDYSEYSNEILSKKATNSDFAKHWIKEKIFWVKISDCERYGFKPNEEKQI
ncbi:MAG: hypothetical protein ACK5KP_11175 [Paludibacteraceae bacterium]